MLLKNQVQLRYVQKVMERAIKEEINNVLYRSGGSVPHHEASRAARCICVEEVKRRKTKGPEQSFKKMSLVIHTQRQNKGQDKSRTNPNKQLSTFC